jgi:site-specific recombinase XerD
MAKVSAVAAAAPLTSLTMPTIPDSSPLPAPKPLPGSEFAQCGLDEPPPPPSVSNNEWKERFHTHAIRCGLGRRTQAIYQGWIVRAIDSIGCQGLAEEEQANAFLASLRDAELAPATICQAVAAINFWRKEVLGLSSLRWRKPRHSTSRSKNPLRTSEIVVLLEHISPQWSLAVRLMVGCGLRVTECIHLKLTDIDLQSNFIHIRHSKNGKSRYVPVPKVLHMDLKLAISRTMHESPWLFPSPKFPDRPVTPRALQQTLGKAAAAAGISKQLSPHSLRHTYATLLLDSGTNLRVIQELLGHSDISTTMVYTHVNPKSLQEVASPIDLLPTNPATSQ